MFKKSIARRLLCLLLATLLFPMTAFSSESVLLRRFTLPVGGDTSYTRSVVIHSLFGRTEERIVEYTPGSGVLPVVTYGSKLYGKSTAREAAAYLASQGMTPLVALNGDYFMTDTGLPIGLVITDGIVRSSDANQLALAFREDGTAFVAKPSLKVSVSVGGKTLSIDYINKARKYYGTYLFTPDFSATTRVSAPGTDIVISGVQGELRLGSTVTGTVERVVSGSAALSIGEGQIILSAESAHGQDLKFSGIEAGMPVSLTVTSSDPALSQAAFAVGCKERLIENGVPVSDLATDAAPRTAVGIRADGSCLFYTVDGRQPGYSRGLSLKAAAARLLELGCVEAVNLDGGGSTAMLAQYPGDSALTLVNSPSDGFLRRGANFIFLVNTALPTGQAQSIHPYPQDMILLSGATQQMTLKAADQAFYAAAVPSSIRWYTSSSGLGSFDEDGVFTAAQPGSGTISAVSGSLEGKSSFTVVSAPDAIKLYNSAGNLLESLRFAENQTEALRLGAWYQGFEAVCQNTCFTFQVIGNVGTVTPEGVFTASGSTGASGVLRISCADFSVDYPVTVGSAPSVAADFENAGTIYSAPGISLSTLSDMAYVRYGKGSARLDYAFEEDQSVLTADFSSPLSGSYLSLWVYGDGSGNTLYARLAGVSQPLLLGRLDFTGWQHLSAKLPAGAPALSGFSLQGAGAGSIWLDRVMCSRQELYDPIPPTVSISGDFADGVLSLSASALDDDGTPIAKDALSFTLDGKPASFSYDPYSGGLTASLAISDFRVSHRVTLVAADFSGNLARAVFELPASGAAAKVFADMNGHWARSYAEYLYRLGVMNGSVSGGVRLCKPDEYLTRAQMAVLTAQYMGVDLSAYAEISLPFTDLGAIPSWALEQVKAMYALGVLQGRFSDGQLVFDSNARITRAEFITVLGRSLNKGYARKDLGFSDLSRLPAYAAEYAGVMTGLGVISGYADNTLLPQNPVTRAEAAKMMCMMT